MPALEEKALASVATLIVNTVPCFGATHLKYSAPAAFHPHGQTDTTSASALFHWAGRLPSRRHANRIPGHSLSAIRSGQRNSRSSAPRPNRLSLSEVLYAVYASNLAYKPIQPALQMKSYTGCFDNTRIPGTKPPLPARDFSLVPFPVIPYNGGERHLMQMERTGN